MSRVLTETVASAVYEAQLASRIIEKKIVVSKETPTVNETLAFVRSQDTRDRLLRVSKLTERPWSPWGQRLCRARKIYGADVVDLAEEILKQDDAANPTLLASHWYWRYYSDREINRRFREGEPLLRSELVAFVR